MNYIAMLKSENEELKNELTRMKEALASFRLHLSSPKFTGTENGERKDWIATGDVIEWLRSI